MAGIPIIRSPMKPAKKGEAPTVEWAKWVEKTLRRLIDEPPTRQRPITGGGGDKPPLWTEIGAIPDTDPVEYQATVTLGYLTYQNANATEAEQGVTGYLVPKIRNTDGEWISMDEVAPVVIPAVPLPALASWVYLRVKTTSDGMPDFEQEDGPVTIEAFDSEQKSIHHVRPSPSGGEEEGDYYFLLLETESNGATTPAPRAKRRITGNREMPNQLIEIANIGGKRELYQGYLVGPDDKHELRTIEQIEARGEEIIKPLDAGDPDADPPVPAEEEGETIKWKRIAENESKGQIQVTTKDGGDVIEIEGNDVFGSYEDERGGRIDVVDGLVTTILTGGDSVGDDFNIELLNVNVTESGGEIFITDTGWGSTQRFLYVRKGRLFLADPGGVATITHQVISRIDGEPSGAGNESGPGSY